MPHPDPDRLAMAALPAEPPDPQVTAHLQECALCRGHVEALRRTVALAREGSPAPAEQPPERVWAAITAELGPDQAADPPPADHRPPPRRRLPAVLTAAAVGLVALVTGAAVGWWAGTASESGEQPGSGSVVLAAVGDDPGASGVATMLGDGRMRVEVSGLPVPADHFLEVWLLDPDGDRAVGVGLLRSSNGDGVDWRGELTLPDGAPVAPFRTLDVSLEPWDGDPTHSGNSVLRGELG